MGYKQILTTISIFILGIFLSLYFIGYINIPILQNVYFKLFVTVPISLSFIFFLIGVHKKKYPRRYMIVYSAIFEIFGYWWMLESWVAYVYIALGLFLIPSYINDWMTYIDEKQKQAESKKIKQ